MDFGAGTGVIGKELHDRGCFVDFVEPEAKCVKWIGEKMIGKKNHRIYETTIAGFKPTREYDVAVVSEVLEHVVDDIGAVKKIYRVLKPGGFAVITVPQVPPLWSQHDVFCRHQRRYSRNRIVDLLKGTGFEIEQVRNWNFATALYRRVVKGSGNYPRAASGFREVLNKILFWYYHAIENEFDFGIGATLVVVVSKPGRRP